MNSIMGTIVKHQMAKESRKFIAPHFPSGVIKPADLRKIADMCEQYPECKIKLSGDLVIGGFSDVKRGEEFREKLGLPTYDIAGPSVRPVKACSGGYICDNNLQDSFSLGARLDKQFTGRQTPFKLVIAVSGCGRCCSESLVKDIGVVATARGYAVYVGGAAGGKPRIGQKVMDNATADAVVAAVEAIVSFYEKKGKPMERLGIFIEKMGLEKFKEACGLNDAR